MMTFNAASLHTPSAWRKFPHAMIAAMLFVLAVNVRFIVIAVASFPGAATTDDFDTSNRYNAVLAQAARDRAIGWTARAGVSGDYPMLDLLQANGMPLVHAAVTAEASRPIGQAASVSLDFHETSPGHYVASNSLTLPGQWDLDLRLSADGHVVHATRRVVLR